MVTIHVKWQCMIPTVKHYVAQEKGVGKKKIHSLIIDPISF